jgi:ABC-type amino acid transport system permease subunit
MDSEYQKQLEAEIDRQLKGLPELPAPRTLAPRVMSAIAVRAAVPWYRQPWPSWPLAFRAASLACLLALFGGLCFAVSALPQAAPVAAVADQCGHWFSGLAVIWRGLSAVAGLLVAAVKHLDPRLLVAGIAAVLFAYAACIALAAGSVRLGLARNQP